MATITTQLCRDNEHQSWVTVTVDERKRMLLQLEHDPDMPESIYVIDSKEDAERLGDIIRNMCIDYM